MKRSSGRSAGSSVASQAAKRKVERGEPPSLPTQRLEHGIHLKTGLPTYYAVYAQPGGGEPSRIDISFMLGFPNLIELFGTAFLEHGSAVSPSSARTKAGELKLGFFEYVRVKYGVGLHYLEINDELLMGFRGYLNVSSGPRVKVLSAGTIRKYLGTLRCVLGALDKGPLSRIAQAISERVPAGPIGGVFSVVPTPVLSIAHLLEIMEAAEREVLFVEQRYVLGQQLLASGREKLGYARSINQKIDVPGLDVVLAMVDAQYPGIIPHLQVIQATNLPLYSLIKSVRCEMGAFPLNGFFHPISSDLVSFAILITIVTVFNPDTSLWLKWGNIELDKDVAGIPMVEIIGRKDRAVDSLVRLLDPNDAVSSGLSVGRLLRFLVKYTARVRPFAMEKHEDFVFLFAQTNNETIPKSWGQLGATFQGPSNDSSWQHSLKKFIERNKLQKFTLGQLRPTILNLVQSLDGSLEAAALVGNHKNLRTTWTHYTSDGIKKEYRERVGQVVLLRERWFNSEGQIDPRIRRARADKGAATPGFMCVDPFESPRPNQSPGRLCSDYGGCPACPLAGAYPEDPESVAYYNALVDAIYRSQGVMSAKTWLERWVPVLSDLKSLLGLVSAQVMSEARQVTVRLPLIG